MWYSKLSNSYEELFARNTNHDNWRIFTEAKELEGNIKADPSYRMIYQNKIIRIFLQMQKSNFGALTKNVGRLIKPELGKELQLRKEYRELLSWYEIWEPEQADSIESAPCIEEENVWQ